MSRPSKFKVDERLLLKLFIDPKERLKLYNGLIKDGKNWFEALDQTIRTIGIKRYSELSGLTASYISMQLKSEGNFTFKVLEKLFLGIGKVNIEITLK